MLFFFYLIYYQHQSNFEINDIREHVCTYCHSNVYRIDKSKKNPLKNTDLFEEIFQNIVKTLYFTFIYIARSNTNK